MQGEQNRTIMESMFRDLYDMDRVCYSESKSGGLHVYFLDYENLGLKNLANVFTLEKLDGTTLKLSWDIKAGDGGSVNELGYIAKTDPVTGDIKRSFYNFIIPPAYKDTIDGVGSRTVLTVHDITNMPISDREIERVEDIKNSFYEKMLSQEIIRGDYESEEDYKAAKCEFLLTLQNPQNTAIIEEGMFKILPEYQLLHLFITLTVVERRDPDTGRIYYRPKPCDDYTVFREYLLKTGNNPRMVTAQQELKPNKFQQIKGFIKNKELLETYVTSVLKLVPYANVASIQKYEWEQTIKSIKYACDPCMYAAAAEVIGNHCNPWEIKPENIKAGKLGESKTAFTNMDIDRSSTTFPCWLNRMKRMSYLDQGMLQKIEDLKKHLGIVETYVRKIPDTWEEFFQYPPIEAVSIADWTGPDMVNPADGLPWFNSPTDDTNFRELEDRHIYNMKPAEVIKILKRTFICIKLGSVKHYYCKERARGQKAIVLQDKVSFENDMSERIIIPKPKAANNRSYGSYTLMDVIKHYEPYFMYKDYAKDLCARSAERAKVTIPSDRTICPTLPMQALMYYNDGITAEDTQMYIDVFKRILYNIAGGAEKELIFLTNWLAHLVQFPTECPDTMLYLYSEAKGTGKTRFVTQLLFNMIGDDHTAVLGMADFTKEFTDNIDERLLLTYDDITTAQMEAIYESHMKTLVTGKVSRGEKKTKGAGKVAREIAPRFIFTSNQIPVLDGDDRRVALMYVAKDDEMLDIYNKYIEAKHTDFIYTVYKYLLNLNIKDYIFKLEVRKLPASHNNVLHTELKHSKMTPVQSFIDALFQGETQTLPHQYIAEMFRMLPDERGVHRFLSGDIYDMYLKFLEQNRYQTKPVTPTTFRTLMVQSLIGPVTTGPECNYDNAGKTKITIYINNEKVEKKGNIWGIHNMRMACERFYKFVGLPLKYEELINTYDGYENMV